MIKTSPSPFNPLNPLNLVFIVARSAWSLGKRFFVPQKDAPAISQVNRAIGEWPSNMFPDVQSPFPMTKAEEHIPEPVDAAPQTSTALKDKLGEISIEPGATTLIALIPMIVSLLKAKKRHLDNIIVKIQAEEKPKNYSIALGNSEEELSFSFQVQSGKALCFPEKSGSGNAASELPPLFPAKQSLLTKFLGPFAFNKNERHTECDIVVEDPGNPTLQNGPVVHPIVFSDTEVIRLVHRDPNVKDPTIKELGDPSEWTELNSYSVKASDLPEAKTPKKFKLKDPNEFVAIAKSSILSTSCREVQRYSKDAW